MGLFDFLSSKSYTDYEAQGDRYNKADDFGSGKLEYEKALSILEGNSVPNPLHHKERIEKKIAGTMESLALQHKNTAENLIEAASFDEAAELLNLASELTENPELAGEIENLLHDLEKRMYSHEYDIQPDYEPRLNTDEQEAGEEYFLALISTMPEEVQKTYLGYGDSFEKGFIALNQGNFENAVELLSQSLDEHDFDVGHIHLELATAYLNLGVMDDALVLLEQFVQYYPEFIRAYEMLCDIYWEKDSCEKAIELLVACPDDIKTDVSINLLMGETLVRAEKLQEAKSFYLEFLKYNGMNQHIARALAQTYEALKETGKAREVYGEILNSCSGCGMKTDPFVKYRYAELSYAAGEIPGSILELYISLCQEDPANREIYFKRISDIYSKRGHHDEAKRFRRFAEQAAEETAGAK